VCIVVLEGLDPGKLETKTEGEHLLGKCGFSRLIKLSKKIVLECRHDRFEVQCLGLRDAIQGSDGAGYPSKTCRKAKLLSFTLCPLAKVSFWSASCSHFAD
jgi:hypothetical protein